MITSSNNVVLNCDQAKATIYNFLAISAFFSKNNFKQTFVIKITNKPVFKFNNDDCFCIVNILDFKSLCKLIKQDGFNLTVIELKNKLFELTIDYDFSNPTKEQILQYLSGNCEAYDLYKKALK